LATHTQGALIATLEFENITSNDAINAATGESQLFIDVVTAGEGQVEFTFRNEGPDPSTIADIYFDDLNNSLSSILSIDNLDPGVSFSLGAAPRKLPGRNHTSPTFVATEDFMIDADAPVGGPNGNGVNPGESLTLLVALSENVSPLDLFNELLNGDLRIGLHVQSFLNGGSEAFVSGGIIDGPAPSIPEPASLSLLLLGLPSFLRRYRRAS